jgi:sigma-B regulation protein RsbU (phosphoserine phosphatase)
MILLIAVPTLVIYVAILGVAMYYTYRESKQAVERSMTQLASSYASRFDGHLREAAQIAETTASFMGTVQSLSDEKIYQQLQRGVARSPMVYGAAMAFEPGTIKPGDELFAPYVCRDGDGFRQLNIDRSVYDWYRDPQYTWFTRPKALGHGVWSEPYFDEGAGNILMATYSAPFQLNGRFGGVSTVDIDLPRLRKTVGGQFEQELDFVILDSQGRFVYDPDPSRILSTTIFDVAEQQNRADLAQLGRQMLGGTSGMASIEKWDSSERVWVFFAPIRSSRWVFASRFPEARILADVRRRTMWTGAALGITLLLTVACIVGVSRLVAAPIARLRDKVLEVGRGNLEVRIDAAGSATDEIRSLSQSFNQMTSELRAHVHRLAEEQAARQRIERDLDIAREIQRGLLPVSKPRLDGYEFAGWSKPADKTGGDYYDWQVLPDGKTLVSLADVTGHGVGPALVTAVCRAYVRASFAVGRELAELMKHLNDLLIADLPPGRFVTCAAALLDTRTHRAELVAAGHGPTFHYVASERRLVEYDANDIPLGVMPDVSYAPQVLIELGAGDLLLFVTDGFFEWARPDEQLFGLARLRQTVLQLAEVPIDELIPRIYAQVEQFAEGAPQEDDVTALVVRRCAAPARV